MIGPVRPSAARLERLLETNPDKFEKLLARDPSIADRFEQGRLLPDAAVQALREAFAPPADLADRLRSRLESFAAPSARATALDLLGLGLATVRELTRDDPA